MRRVTGTMLVAFGFMLPAMSEAAVLNEQELQGLSATTVRPCSDFLDAQGSTSLFFPPVGDQLGWTNLGPETFALVDYAGLASDYLEGMGVDLGTKPQCTVRERALDDGRAEITVGLSTTRALGFAQSVEDLIANDFDFLNTPTIFGNKAQDVAAGARPAVGPALFNVSFVIEEPGAALPDLRIALQQDPCAYEPVQLRFQSQTNGFTNDGRRAQLRVAQVASTVCDGVVDDFDFTTEVVDIVPPAR